VLNAGAQEKANVVFRAITRSMTAGDFAGWLLANETVAVVTWVGSIVAVVGLPATFKQGLSARRAADAASIAVRDLEGRLNLANLSYSYSQLDGIRSLVASGNMPAAQVLLGPVKRTIVELFQLLSPQAEFAAKVEIARKSLKAMEYQLGLAVGSTNRYKASALARAISGLSDFLAEAETALKFPSRRS
jgi:hypothetical protein